LVFSGSYNRLLVLKIRSRLKPPVAPPKPADPPPAPALAPPDAAAPPLPAFAVPAVPD